MPFSQGRIGSVGIRSAHRASPSAHPVGAQSAGHSSARRNPVLRRVYAHPSPPRRGPRALLLAALTLLLVPAASSASTGGTGTSGSSSSPSAVHRVNRTETASGDGITVKTVETGVLTWRTKFSGTTPRRDVGKLVE